MNDGYYWARMDRGDEISSRFVVLREEGSWYCIGLEQPMEGFSDTQIICPVKRPDN